MKMSHPLWRARESSEGREFCAAVCAYLMPSPHSSIACLGCRLAYERERERELPCALLHPKQDI